MNRGPSYARPMKVDPQPKMLPRVTIVGEAPNSKGVQKYDTRSGQRLLELMGGRKVSWHNVHEAYLEKWSARVARERIRFWLATHPTDSEPLLLLGRKVCAAFRIPSDAGWLEWYASSDHRHPMITLPHPSARNQWWNNAENMQAAAELLSAVASGELPRYDYVKKDEKA